MGPYVRPNFPIEHSTSHQAPIGISGVGVKEIQITWALRFGTAH